MLVLTRKIGESFVIGDDIKITIIDIIGGNKVRVGIEAPHEVPVYREEIYTAYREEIVEQEGIAVSGASMTLDGGVGGRVF